MQTLAVTLIERHDLAQGVIGLTLQADNGGLLPSFEPGAHVDVYLPNNQVRSYSLTNLAEAAGTPRYQLAVGLTAQSRGGSSWIHQHAMPGLKLQVGHPRNNFGLREDKAPVLLIAGGIGVTPLQLMAQALSRRDQSFRLVYAARSRARAAYLDELLLRLGSRLSTHFDDETGGRPLDVSATLSGLSPQTRIYCCGPQALMDSVRDTAARLGHTPDRLHFESFTPAAQALEQSGRFTVHLSRTGSDILIEPGKSILDTLEEHGVIVPSVCREGVCGSCECMVIEGEVEHRDQILSPAEQAANRSMMVCVSRARSDRLVLDL
jgi:ferredoxin-NADP reductase